MLHEVQKTVTLGKAREPVASKQLERNLSDLLEQFQNEEKLNVMAGDELDSMSEEIENRLDTDEDENVDDDEIYLLEIEAVGGQDEDCPHLKRKNAKIFAPIRQRTLYG